jgi:glyoxylase-like metal-dependent hydrolase (beta-lactamase superfamily II)
MNHSKLTDTSGALCFQIIPAGSIRCNAVVFWHEQSRDAVIVDPTDDARPAIAFSRRLELRVRQILLTHGHFEHCADAERAATELACPAFLHADDHPLFFDIPSHALSFGQTISPRTLTPLPIADNQVIQALPEYPIMVLHVPGHSQGSVAFYVPAAGWVCVGDTLFQGGIARADLPGGDASKLTDSVERRLFALPDHTLVIPGHGPITSVGDEKRTRATQTAPRIEPTL